MAHQSLYRKYRPDTFDDVIGQRHIERTLRNAVAQGSVAHAYLFSGPRGTGKTTTARILAKALLCDQGPSSNPDGTCPACLEVSEGTHPDVIEMDAASQTGVDNVREEIISRVAYAPQRGRYKIYIIDEVHMLSTQAFNALLKTLEEPPPHVIFIMCTTHPQAVPETVRSRCQRFEFRPISAEDIAGRLQHIAEAEGLVADRLALALIARHANGGMRDAITSLEQLLAYTDGNIKVEDVEGMFGEVSSESLAGLLMHVARRNTAECFYWISNQAEMGADLPELAKSLLAYVRDLYIMMLFPEAPDLIDATEEERFRLKGLVDVFEGPERIARIITLLADLTAAMRYSTEPRILFELALVRMSSTQGEFTLEALSERIERLERQIQGGVPIAAAAPEQEAPAPVPAPKPAPASAIVESPAINPSQAQPAPGSDDPKRRWRAILAEIRKLKVSHYPFFMPATASYNEEGVLVIEWAQSDSFSKTAAESVKDVLEKAIFTIYGREMPYLLQVAIGRAGKPVDSPKPYVPEAPTSVVEAPEFETVPDEALVSDVEGKLGDAPAKAAAKVESAPVKTATKVESAPAKAAVTPPIAGADDALLDALNALGGKVVEITNPGSGGEASFEEGPLIDEMVQDQFPFNPDDEEEE